MQPETLNRSIQPTPTVHPRGFTPTYELIQVVARLARPGIPLDRQVLIRVSEHTEWEDELDSLKYQASRWVDRSLKRRLIYKPATDVLHKWARTDGMIGELLGFVQRNDGKRRSTVEEAVGRLRQPQDLHRLVDEAADRTVQHKAFQQLVRRVDEALGILDSWLAYRAVEEDGPGEYRLKHARRMKKELGTKLPNAITELAALASTLEDPSEHYCALSLSRAMKSLSVLLDGSGPPPVVERSVEAVFTDPLLLFPGIPVRSDGTLGALDRQEVGHLVLAGLAGSRLDWLSAYEQRLKLHDMGATARMLELGGPPTVSPEDIARIRAERERRSERSFRVLERSVKARRDEVELAGMNGLLGESERAALSSDVDSAERMLSDRKDATLRLVADTVARVEASLKSKRDAGLQRVRKRFSKLELDEADPIRARIAAAIGAGDALTATELIGQVEEGLPIAEAEPVRSDELRDFFPELLSELESWVGPTELDIQRIRLRESVGPVPFAELSDAQAVRAAAVLESWHRASRNISNPVKSVAKDVFELIGFNVLSVSTSQDRGSRAWSTVQVEPIRDRASCPVPLFGSGAAGGGKASHARYRVLWVWGDLTAQDVVSAVGETNDLAPTFVFYMGILGVDGRRAVARFSRERRRTFLVLDSAVLLYLAAKAGARMPAMFAVTLPFTFLEPYVVAAGVVPPELFYGRERERRQVTDRFGTNFIYGGRQLGKTALLRHTRHSFHRPAEGQVAVYLNLQAEQIGLGPRAGARLARPSRKLEGRGRGDTYDDIAKRGGPGHRAMARRGRLKANTRAH